MWQLPCSLSGIIKNENIWVFSCWPLISISFPFDRQQYWPSLIYSTVALKPSQSHPLLCFLFIIIIIIILYNIVLVLPYINMHPPRVYTCSPSWTPLPPPSLNHPSGSSQCTSPKHPVSYIEPGLVIRFLYDIIYVSMPFSKSSPSSLSHRVQKTVLYICVSFAVSQIFFRYSVIYYKDPQLRTQKGIGK